MIPISPTLGGYVSFYNTYKRVVSKPGERQYSEKTDI